MKRATYCSIPYSLARYISIHALVKRATVNVLLYVVVSVISIHALVKRATRPFVKTV